MLERFTERARRVIFYARYEASQYGSRTIETEHLLLGLCREDARLMRHFLGSADELASIREQIEAQVTIRERISTSIEVPLSPESKRILHYAAAEADQLGSRHIATEHLLLGMFHDENSLAAKMLAGLGLRVGAVREDLKSHPMKESKSDPAEAYKASARTTRTGIGYDLHRLEPRNKLTIGGIEIPFDKGSLGHSDGDVLAHAICDALLGAAGLGDIGTHFPDTDPKWKGASSLVFLKHVSELFAKEQHKIGYIDAVVILERPKLGPHFSAMREALAGALGISVDRIHLKAKTNEGVDAIGRGEAVACHAVATVRVRG